MTRTTARRTTARSAGLVAGLASAVLLAGCGSGSTEPAAGAADAAPATSPATALEVVDPWVKAADSGMTAAFGTLENPTDADVHITAVSSTASTASELHEMATVDGAMVMREKEDGFVVPAGGSHVLDPGGDHLMLMDLVEPLVPGEDVTITLTAEDGSTLDVVAPARAFAGAEEEYTGEEHGADGTDGGHGTEDTGSGR